VIASLVIKASSVVNDAVPLEDIKVLKINPGSSVGRLTLPDDKAEEISKLGVPQKSLQVSEEPWGETRPRCICKNLAIWDSTGTKKTVIVVEPEMSGNNIVGKDAHEFTSAVKKMAAEPTA